MGGDQGGEALCNPGSCDLRPFRSHLSASRDVKEVIASDWSRAGLCNARLQSLKSSKINIREPITYVPDADTQAKIHFFCYSHKHCSRDETQASLSKTWLVCAPDALVASQDSAQISCGNGGRVQCRRGVDQQRVGMTPNAYEYQHEPDVRSSNSCLKAASVGVALAPCSPFGVLCRGHGENTSKHELRDRTQVGK